jgi:low affinity Fe/Cu permease
VSSLFSGIVTALYTIFIQNVSYRDLFAPDGVNHRCLLVLQKKALRKRSRATTLYMWTGRPVAFWLLANGIFPSGGTGSASAVTVFQITALLVRSVMLDEVLG